MIRIDEIYETIFVPWASERSLRGIHWFDPFGSTDFANLCSLPAVLCYDAAERYLFWDQEPLQPETVAATLSQFKTAFDGRHHMVTSEYRSEQVDLVCAEYGFIPHYYWFHGWAALDWYRGYDRSLLIQEPKQRKITKTFIMPNRIIGGQRQHRLKMLYWIFKLNLMNNYISCPQICPAENKNIKELLLCGVPMMPDAVEVFDRVKLPLNMPGEVGHPMHSYRLSLFDESAECLLYLVTETVATGRRLHLTEKTFKPICLRMPFIVVGTCGSLSYLRSYGFQTFATLWDESYDTVQDDDDRIAAIAVVLADLDSKSLEQKQQLSAAAAAIVEHNYHHFYSGAFEDILWQELQSMLAEF